MTAFELYYRASTQFAAAQHPVLETNDEKRYLYAGVRRCYDRVIALAPYRLEHLDIPWNGTLVSGNLHLCPNRTSAPLIFYIPGCDSLKEAWPHPFFNAAHQRGMHVFAFDGPGHPESNLRGIRLTADNFEDAAGAALDVLVRRPEIDAERIGVYSISLASSWGLRFAARDRRIRAIAAPAASVAEKYFLMDLESPRWKQLFAYTTQSKTERAAGIYRCMSDRPQAVHTAAPACQGSGPGHLTGVRGFGPRIDAGWRCPPAWRTLYGRGRMWIGRRRVPHTRRTAGGGRPCRRPTRPGDALDEQGDYPWRHRRSPSTAPRC